MKQNFKQFAFLVVAFVATIGVFSSCSEEESMVDATREQKVQELIRVSRSLADKHEIAMCFTEQMIRGGVDTLTVKDLERAYEVYAANTVEIYVCTDSTQVNTNGLKLSRSSRMVRETTLMPGEGNTILATYSLTWNPYRYKNQYERCKYNANLNIRIDWNHTGVSGVAVLFPKFFNETICYMNSFQNTIIEREQYGNIRFSTSTFFNILYDMMYCTFALWVEQDNYTQRVRLTLDNYNYGLEGVLELSNDNMIVVP